MVPMPNGIGENGEGEQKATTKLFLFPYIRYSTQSSGFIYLLCRECLGRPWSVPSIDIHKLRFMQVISNCYMRSKMNK